MMSGVGETAGRTVMVTGAGGFIGSAVVRALVARGVAVRALVAAPGATYVRPPPGVAVVQGEIDDLSLLTDAAAGVGVVVHAAGPSSVAASFERPAEFARVHTVGTATVLEACHAAGVARLVHVSSAEVYGQPRSNPVTEDHPLQARSPYGAAKIGAELLLRSARPLPRGVAMLRPFSVYGPGQPSASLLSAILRQARRDDAVVLADLRPVRDYCFVDDLVAAVLRAMEVDLALETGDGARAFNIGAGVGTSVADLAAAALLAAGRSLPVREDPSRRRPPGADILHMVADTTRARLELGWRPATALTGGLRQTLASIEAETELR